MISQVFASKRADSQFIRQLIVNGKILPTQKPAMVKIEASLVERLVRKDISAIILIWSHLI